MDYFIDWQEHAGVAKEKFFKATLWQGTHVMVGLNCLEPGQVQSEHSHAGADKVYFVLEGNGKFKVGDEERVLSAGTVVIAPAGIDHGVSNSGESRLSLLIAMAPGPR